LINLGLAVYHICFPWFQTSLNLINLLKHFRIFVTNLYPPASNHYMMRNNDKELVERVISGNTRDFALLVDKYKDLAFTVAFRVVNNREDAEEVAQDAFVKAYTGLRNFRNQSLFSTWLFRIVYNTAVSKKRLKKIEYRSLDDVHNYAVIKDSPQESENMNIETILLEQAMQQLPEDERTMITLYYMNESNIDEIHQITGLSKSNVKVKLFRARKKLQELLIPIKDRIMV